MELTEEVKVLLLTTAKELKGSARRMFMARTVQALGEGGQRLAERELGWNRGTIRKGMHEAAHGIACVDGFGLRGRKGQYISLKGLPQEVERREDQARRQNRETAHPAQRVQVEAHCASWVCICCRFA